ncbi:MAG: hypothetical protein R3F14_35255 [Polyangiaceae bacterium]
MAEDTGEARGGDGAEDAAAVGALGDGLGEVGILGEEPLEATAEVVEAAEGLAGDDVDRAERDEADHAADGEVALAACVLVLEEVEIEAVGLRPEGDVAVVFSVVHGVDDAGEVLEELAGDVLVGGVGEGELEGDAHEIKAIHGHPGGGVGLFEDDAGGHALAAVEERDVVEAEEAALEDVVALGVALVDPPGEVDEELVEHALQEDAVSLAALAALDLVDLVGGPGLDWGVQVGEFPLVGGDLAVRVLVPLLDEELELGLRLVDVDRGHGEGVEGEVPGGEPGILPLVRHGDDVGDGEVAPLAVSAAAAGVGGRDGVAVEPGGDIVVVELEAPEEAGGGLAVDGAAIVREVLALDVEVIFVGLAAALGEEGVGVLEGAVLVVGGEADADADRGPGGDVESVPGGGLGTMSGGVHGGEVASDDALVEGVLDVRGAGGGSPETVGCLSRCG